MADELIKDWEKFQLTEDENSVIGNFNGDADGALTGHLTMALVGKLLTVKTFNIEAMTKTLTSVWRLENNIVIKTIDTNLFIFQFVNEEDRKRVLDGMPWSFDGKILLLKEINCEEQPSEVTFDSTPMWIRLLDVPFNRRDPSVMKEIGDVLGGFLEIDNATSLGWGEFMRIKAMVNVNKPLRRGLLIAVGASKTKWIDIKYERLADFCFYCGVLDHTDRECEKKEEAGERGSDVVYQYGPWLRSSPLKSSKSVTEKLEKEKKIMEKVFTGSGNRCLNYNDPNVVKLGPVGAARKLKFASPNADMGVSSPKEREIQLTVMMNEQSKKLVFRPKQIQSMIEGSLGKGSEGQNNNESEQDMVGEVLKYGGMREGDYNMVGGGKEKEDIGEKLSTCFSGGMDSNGGQGGVKNVGSGGTMEKVGGKSWKRIMRGDDVLMRESILGDSCEENATGGSLKRCMRGDIEDEANGDGTNGTKKHKSGAAKSVVTHNSRVEGLGNNQALERQ